MPLGEIFLDVETVPARRQHTRPGDMGLSATARRTEAVRRAHQDREREAMNNPAYVVCHMRLPEGHDHTPQPTFAVFSESHPTTTGLCVLSVIHKIDWCDNFGDAMTEAIKIMDADARFVRIDDPRTSRAGWRLATAEEFRSRITEARHAAG